MKENLKPLLILFGFVASVVVVFFLESQFLLKDKKKMAATSQPVTTSVKAEDKSTESSVMGEVKEVFEDFEKVKEGPDLADNHIFTYGSIKVIGTKENTKGKGYSGSKAVKVTWTGKDNFGGWGKGIGHYYSLNAETDHLNFFVLYPKGNEDLLKIVLQDDDDGNGSYDHDHDDAWYADVHLKPSPDWQLFSFPVKDLKDQTPGGDSKLNVREGEGNLITFLFEFTKVGEYTEESVWYFDHVNITKGRIPVGKDISEIPVSMGNLYK